MNKMLIIAAILAVTSLPAIAAEPFEGIKLIPAPKHVVCTNGKNFTYSKSGFASKKRAIEFAESVNSEGNHTCRANQKIQ